MGDELTWGELAEFVPLHTLAAPRLTLFDGEHAMLRLGDVDGLTALWPAVRETARLAGWSPGQTVLAACFQAVLRATRDASELITRRPEPSVPIRLPLPDPSPNDQLMFFKAKGIPTQFKMMSDLELVARTIAAGQQLLLNVNPGALWRDILGGHAGEESFQAHYRDGIANHTVQVTGAAIDPDSNRPLGFFVNDPAFAEGGRYVAADGLALALLGTRERPAGGSMVATSLPIRT